MAVRIAPSPRQQFEDANGVPYVGGKLFTYAAGSSTKQSTFTDSTGNTANANPIVLDAAGRTPFGLWLTAGLNYKFVLALSTDTDPPTSPVFTEDNISGVNDSATTTSQWIAAGATPTYINGTTLSLVGDKTADFHVGRRLKLTVTAGTVYAKITASAYTTLTTVTVSGGTLDSGLSAVELSIMTATNHAIPVLTSTDLSAIGIQAVDATLTALAALTTGADQLPYSTGTDTFGQTPFTPFSRTVLDDIDGAAWRATLGVVAATEVLSGLIELATNAEVSTGTDAVRAVTPAGLRGGLNATGTAPVYASRAWVNFNGTGAVAINASGNVSSITDNGVGDYTVNFTTAMSDANYAWSLSGQQPVASTSTGVIGNAATAPTASALRILSVNANAATDFSYITCIVFR